MKGTWETTDGGGGSTLLAVLAVLAAAAIAGPVLAAVATAVAELVRIVLIVAGTLAALAVAGVVAFAAVRVHRWRTSAPARASLPAPPSWRAIQTPPAPRPLPASRPPAIEQHVHHHWHGVSAEDVAAIIARQQEDQP
jgi:hypothetical protein